MSTTSYIEQTIGLSPRTTSGGHVWWHMSLSGSKTLKRLVWHLPYWPLRMEFRLALQTFLACWSVTTLRLVRFFTPNGEINISPWEMQKVSRLHMDEFRYEEHVPPFAELRLLWQKGREMYSTHWEVLCHFYICRGFNKWSRGLPHLAWADYFFLGVEDGEIGDLTPVFVSKS